MSDYWASDDPYCWSDASEVLKNRLGLKSSAPLQEAETAFVEARARAGLPSGRFSLTHYRACHTWLFGDVYDWAGSYRTVRLAKGSSVFCFPEHIDGQMKALFEDLKRGGFLRQTHRAEFVSRAAWFWSEINAIDPFREGNGRVQTLFLANMALSGGWYLDLTRLQPTPTIDAMIASFKAGSGVQLEDLVNDLIRA
jgi:cell filamentation protein